MVHEARHFSLAEPTKVAMTSTVGDEWDTSGRESLP
jgi:hypothetical protein